jgi:hypothetical protein
MTATESANRAAPAAEQFGVLTDAVQRLHWEPELERFAVR